MAAPSPQSQIPFGSPAILAEIQSLQPRLPLQKLQSHLALLSSILSTTLAQTTAFPSLQTRLQTSALTVAHLLERTRTTLSLFRTATSKNLDVITLTTDLLSDNLLLAARKILSKSTAANTRLATASTNLALAFESAASDLAATLTEAYETERSQRARVETLRKETDSSYVHLNFARDQHAQASTNLSEASSLYDDAQQKEVSAQRRGNLLHAAHVSVVVASFVTTRSTALALSVTGVAALAATSDQQAARAREERAVHLRHKNDARDGRAAAGVKVAEVEEKLRFTRREAVVADSILGGLEKCVEVLRELAGVMVVVEGFWRGVGDRIDGEIAELVAVGAGLEERERKAFWEGQRFQSRVDRVKEFWTAVGEVCRRGLEGVGSIAVEDTGATGVIAAGLGIERTVGRLTARDTESRDGIR